MILSKQGNWWVETDEDWTVLVHNCNGHLDYYYHPGNNIRYEDCHLCGENIPSRLETIYCIMDITDDPL